MTVHPQAFRVSQSLVFAFTPVQSSLFFSLGISSQVFYPLRPRTEALVSMEEQKAETKKVAVRFTSLHFLMELTESFLLLFENASGAESA